MEYLFGNFPYHALVKYPKNQFNFKRKLLVI